MVELLESVHWSIAIRDVPRTQVRVGAAGEVDDAGGMPTALFRMNAYDQLRTASIGKLFLLAELMRQVRFGDIALDDVIDRDDERPDDPMEDSGLLYMLAQRTWQVKDLAVLVGAFSDNYATNLLVERVGLANVQRCAREVLGYRTSNLLDKVRWERPKFSDLPNDMSCGCAEELCDYMARLSDGSLIDAQASAGIERWLGADADTSMVAGAFDLDPLAHWPDDAGFRLRHKTGTESDVRGDVGFVTDETTSRTVAYAVLANWDKERYGDVRDEVLSRMRTLGTLIREYLQTGDVTIFDRSAAGLVDGRNRG